MAFPLAMQVLRFPLLITIMALETSGEVSRYVYVYARLGLVEAGLQLLVSCYCSGFLLHKVSRSWLNRACTDANNLTFRPVTTLAQICSS